VAVEDSFNFRRIDDQVTTSGVVGADRLAELAVQGYSAVINLLPDDSEWAVENEAGIIADQGLAYVYIPVTWNDPTDADLAAFTEAMTAVEGKVHVHCAANFRVTAFYAIYAQQNLSWSADQSEELISGVWNPADHDPWQAFIADHTGSER